MATRAAIARCNQDGKYRTIYLHWDGYPEHAGQILKNNYTDSDLVDQLIGLGDMSIISPDLEECVFYSRDKGEHFVDVAPQDFDTVDEIEEFVDCEYIYVYYKGVWSCKKVKTGEWVA